MQGSSDTRLVESRAHLQGSTLAVAQVVVCALLALVVLPAALGPAQPGGSAPGDVLSVKQIVWLAAAAVVALWLLAPAPALSRLIAGPLVRLLRPDTAGSAVHEAAVRVLARWLVVLEYVVLATATLSTPLVAALATIADPPTVAAGVAVAILLLLLLALQRLHVAASPVLQAIVLQGLDALVPTVDSPPADATPAAVSQPARRDTRPMPASPPVSEPAPGPGAGGHAAATVAAPTVNGATDARTVMDDAATVQPQDSTRPDPGERTGRSSSPAEQTQPSTPPRSADPRDTSTVV
jgi:hypothetical protein